MENRKAKYCPRSLAEAEYRSLTEATNELIWFHSFLSSLGVFLYNPTPLFYDNQSALHIANTPVFHKRTKHIELDCHFVREKLEAGLLKFSKISSQQQPADMFTKLLVILNFSFLIPSWASLTYMLQLEGE